MRDKQKKLFSKKFIAAFCEYLHTKYELFIGYFSGRRLRDYFNIGMSGCRATESERFVEIQAWNAYIPTNIILRPQGARYDGQITAHREESRSTPLQTCSFCLEKSRRKHIYSGDNQYQKLCNIRASSRILKYTLDMNSSARRCNRTPLSQWHTKFVYCINWLKTNIPYVY